MESQVDSPAWELHQQSNMGTTPTSTTFWPYHEGNVNLVFWHLGFFICKTCVIILGVLLGLVHYAYEVFNAVHGT